MLKGLQIAVLVALGIVVVLYAVWAIEHPTPALTAGVVAALAYVGIVSLLLFGDPERWKKEGVLWAFRAIASTSARAAVSLGVFLIISAILATLLFREREKSNFFVEVFNGGRANPAPDVTVLIKEISSAEQYSDITKDTGEVRFRVKAPGLWQSAVVVTSNGSRRSATRAAEQVKLLRSRPRSISRRFPRTTGLSRLQRSRRRSSSRPRAPSP